MHLLRHLRAVAELTGLLWAAASREALLQHKLPPVSVQRHSTPRWDGDSMHGFGATTDKEATLPIARLPLAGRILAVSHVVL